MPVIQRCSQANIPSLATSTTVSVANPERYAWGIQNQGVNTLYVRLAAGASDTVYHYALKACTSAKDGTGGVYEQMSGGVHTGVISVAGTSPSYTFMELGTA